MSSVKAFKGLHEIFLESNVIPKVRWIQDYISNEIGYIQFGIISQILHPLLTTCILPVAVLVVLNYNIFLGSARIVSNHDVHMSRIMVTIVTVFIGVTIPRVSFVVNLKIGVMLLYVESSLKVSKGFSYRLYYYTPCEASTLYIFLKWRVLIDNIGSYFKVHI